MLRSTRLFLLASIVVTLALGSAGCNLITHFDEFTFDDGGPGMDGGGVDGGEGDAEVGDGGDAGRRDSGMPVDANGALALVVTKTGSGAGLVTSDVGLVPIACGDTCTGYFDPDTVVTLTASPEEGSVFAGWTGGCTGTESTCMVTVSAMTDVEARFDLGTFTVTVALAGDGGGRVASSDTMLDCDGSATSACSATYTAGTEITLSATPEGLAVFGGWTGPCAGVAECTFTVSGDVTVGASFDLDQRTLAVTTAGTGGGTVTSTPAGIDCGADCMESYTAGTMVTLTATPGAGSDFAGWSGDCTGMSATCMLTMDAARSVSATFTLQQHTITVERTGGGAGTVVSSLPTATTIDCGATCVATLDYGTVVRLQAVPEASSTFAGWSGGGCTGTGLCTVTLEAATTVSASFTLIDRSLTVTRTGAGTVSSDPAGINCGAGCNAAFGHGTSVTLTATPDIGQRLSAWGGACSGAAPTCMVAMTSDRTVSATFVPQRFTLSAATNGDGGGSVSSVPAGISCGSDCTEDYDYNQMVTLTATPTAGSNFAGWGGACSGTGSCVVTMTAARSVTATFTIGSTFLSVVKAGTGAGTVTSSPAGINCGSTCGASFMIGSMITLSASADAGSTFAGWSGGGCSGTGTCVVTLAASTTVTATFTSIPRTLTVTNAGSGTGTVSSSPAGINCPSDCSENYTHGVMVTLTASASASSTFTGWSGGGCSGTAPCTLTMDMARSVTATFALRTYNVAVTRSGGGSGSVSSSPAGITCGTDCDEIYTHATMVTLTATPAVGSVFIGWSGVTGCGASTSCAFTVTSAVTAVATFALATYPLTVTNAGSGVVQASDGTIDCGSTCNATYTHGTNVVLTATPSSGYRFSGWSGACTGTGNCVVSMTAARSVTATFIRIRTLTLTVIGPGSTPLVTVSERTTGMVLATCRPGVCMVDVDEGTVVDLVGQVSLYDPYAPFLGWSGDCSGASDTCTLTVSANRAATGTWRVVNVAFVTAATYRGSLTVSAADTNCQSAAASRGFPGSYVAWLSTPSSSAVSRIGTGSGWVRPDGLPIASTAADLLAGRLIHPIVIDPTGTDQRSSTETRVWTGTLPDGTSGSGSGAAQHCVSWTDTVGSGTAGAMDRTTGGWTAFDQYVSCNEALHIYCLGVSQATTMVVPPPSAPSGADYVFVTTRVAPGNGAGVWGGSGLTGFDNMCNSEPGRPPGTYRAYLGTMTAGAASRIPGTGPYIRADGWMIGGSAALTSGSAPLLAGVMPAMGTPPNQPYWAAAWEVWTGMENGPMGLGGGINSCMGWSSNASSATGGGVGHPESTVLGSTAAGVMYPGWARGTPYMSAACNTPRHVYCVQTGP